MQSLMIVRHRAVAVVGEAGLPMAVATLVEAEPPLRCAPIRAMAMAVLVRQRRLPCELLRPPLWWRKWLPNRLLRKLSLSNPLPSQRCLRAAPVVVVQRPAERAKAPVILFISPIGSVESVGLLISGWS